MSAIKVEGVIEMYPYLLTMQLWKERNTTKRNRDYFVCDFKLTCSVNNVSLKFCPVKVVFPFLAANVCLCVSKNSLSLVLHNFLLNSSNTVEMALFGTCTLI